MLLISAKQSIFTSKLLIYLCGLFLILNQCLSTHSLRIYTTDFDQNSVEDTAHDYYPRWDWNPSFSSDDYPLEENNYSVVVEPTIQRRFCCMSPVGGRKRSIRSLARDKKQRRQNDNSGQNH